MIYAATLDQLGGLQGEVTFNAVTAAMSRMALFGLKHAQNLTITLCGGRLPSDSGPLAIADQTLTLTPSATNYVYADATGVAAIVTSPPAGWPGPLALSARALLELVVGANSITSGTCWSESIGQQGPTGPTGPSGSSGTDFWLLRKRVRMVNGFSAGSAFTSGGSPGFEDLTTIGSSSLQPEDSSTMVGSIPRLTLTTSGGTANTSGGLRATNNLYTLGNAAKRGGFDITFRFAAIATQTHTRSFVGLFDVSGGDPSASVDPSALLNIIGVGGDDGDANFSFMVNDGSGAATKTALGSNFPQHGSPAPNKVYELRLWADANAGLVNYSITDIETGNNASGNASSNIPAGTTFLGWLIYANTGSGTITNAQISFMQVAGNTRY